MGEARLFEHTQACMYTFCEKKKNNKQTTQNVILAFPYGEEVKKYDPEGLKRKRTKR